MFTHADITFEVTSKESSGKADTDSTNQQSNKQTHY